MPKKVESHEEKIVYLMQCLLAIELWRGGLSQAEIGLRLGVAKGTANQMLKGVSRYIQTEK